MPIDNMSLWYNDILNHVVATSHGCPCVAVRRRDGALLQQSHQLAHGVRHGQLRLSFNKNIQLGVLAGPRHLARRIEAALCSDGCTRGLQDLGHVRSVGDGPPSFFCREVSI